jgi:hypothetical protein
MLRNLLIPVLLVVLAAGCSSIQTMTEKSSDADFDAYTTWDWYPGGSKKTGDPRIDLAENMHEFIRAAIERDLAGRGYKRNIDSPELYVDYHVTIQDEVNSQVINNHYDEAFYPEYQLDLPGIQDTYQYSWTQGALLILVLDADSKKLVWRGLAQTDVNTQGPRKEAREKLDKAVEKLIKDVPKT